MHGKAFYDGYIHKSAKDKVEKVMGEFKRGELRSGSKDGPVVKNRDQAIAIALSEQEKEAKMSFKAKPVMKSPQQLRRNKKLTRAKEFFTGKLDKKIGGRIEDFEDSRQRRKGYYGVNNEKPMPASAGYEAYSPGPSPDSMGRFERGPMASYNRNVDRYNTFSTAPAGFGTAYGIYELIRRLLKGNTQGQENDR